jgi:hypothetical protein
VSRLQFKVIHSSAKTTLEDKIRQKFPDITDEKIMEILEKSFNSQNNTAYKSNSLTFSRTNNLEPDSDDINKESSLQKLSREIAEGATRKSQLNKRNTYKEIVNDDDEQVESDDFNPKSI